MIRTLETDKWTWVAEKDGKVVGKIMAAPLHNNIVFLERIEMEGNYPAIVMGLCRHALDECFLRGYTGFMVTLCPNREAERKLLGMLRKRLGGYVCEPPFVVALGSTIGKLSVEDRLLMHQAISTAEAS